MALAPSAIREIYNAASRVPGSLRLEVGEPDFPTPPWVVDAAHAAARGGETHYTPNTGIHPLREALADKVRRINGWDARPEECIVTAGGVQALNLALTVLLDPGDEVLLPDPLWPNFLMIAHLISARVLPYVLHPERGFLPDLNELEALVSPRTKVLVINFPSNPTGAVASTEDLAALVGFARRHGLWLISDECYDELAFDGVVRSAQAVEPYERTISVYTFSKTYAMTGWRVEYAFAPAATLEMMGRMQEAMVSCVNTPAQFAALAALQGPQDVVATMRDAYRRRAAAAVAVLEAGAIAVNRPDGAFYLWVDTAPDRRDSITLAHDLLAAARSRGGAGSRFRAQRPAPASRFAGIGGRGAARGLSPAGALPTGRSTAGGVMSWDPQLYLRFGDERAQPFHDLLARVQRVVTDPAEVGLVVDLGCGPGSLTATLGERFGAAQIVGVDASAEMIADAAAAQRREAPVRARRCVDVAAPRAGRCVDQQRRAAMDRRSRRAARTVARPGAPRRGVRVPGARELQRAEPSQLRRAGGIAALA